MTAARYEVLHVDPRTGEIRASLPVASISFTDTLNAEGAAVVVIPLDAPEAHPADLGPIRSSLVILRDGAPVWGGILWTLSADLAAGTLTLNASGYHSYYKTRAFSNGYTGKRRDQTGLLQDWFKLCTNGIETDVSHLSPTGRLRDRVWTRSEFKVISDAIEELAEDENGFDFRYEPFWIVEGERVGNRFLKYSVGSRSGLFELVHRINCDVGRVDYDGSQIATDVYTVGADTGSGEKLVGIAGNDALRETMPTKRVIAAFNDVKSTETLIDKAGAVLDIGRAPIAIPTVTVYPGLYGPLDFVPGDVGIVQVDSGYVALWDEFVITERTTEIDANGTELISLSLANREVFNSGQ
ncbi:hypothetical protein ACIBKZ_15600 [Streptomyces sp. NPDC050421]|uniref:hypothetical protein n=1 Tax=Streptomyces sp. NPDC050421 TaxID=3365613 RepID=UPI0037B41E2F